MKGIKKIILGEERRQREREREGRGDEVLDAILYYTKSGYLPSQVIYLIRWYQLCAYVIVYCTFIRSSYILHLNCTTSLYTLYTRYNYCLPCCAVHNSTVRSVRPLN